MRGAYLVRVPRGDHPLHGGEVTSSGACRGVPLQHAAVSVCRLQPGEATAGALVLHGRAHIRRVHVCLFAQAPRVRRVRAQRARRRLAVRPTAHRLHAARTHAHPLRHRVCVSRYEQLCVAAGWGSLARFSWAWRVSPCAPSLVTLGCMYIWRPRHHAHQRDGAQGRCLSRSRCALSEAEGWWWVGFRERGRRTCSTSSHASWPCN
jgi:hypothetical protein